LKKGRTDGAPALDSCRGGKKENPEKRRETEVGSKEERHTPMEKKAGGPITCRKKEAAVWPKARPWRRWGTRQKKEKTVVVTSVKETETTRGKGGGEKRNSPKGLWTG